MKHVFTIENDYGCTKTDSVDDMSYKKKGGTLTEQLDRNGISYSKHELSMGTLTAEPAYLVHYTNKTPMTVLVIPAAGADSWCKEYYYFPYMTADDAQLLNWYDVYQHVREVSWETIKNKTKVAKKCPGCGKLPANTYEDLRGKERCRDCHALIG
jgi:hypothetical protein